MIRIQEQEIKDWLRCIEDQLVMLGLACAERQRAVTAEQCVQSSETANRSAEKIKFICDTAANRIEKLEQEMLNSINLTNLACFSSSLIRRELYVKKKRKDGEDK